MTPEVPFTGSHCFRNRWASQVLIDGTQNPRVGYYLGGKGFDLFINVFSLIYPRVYLLGQSNADERYTA
jgi:hypothetical protein